MPQKSNSDRLTRLEANYSNISGILNEIKDLIKENNQHSHERFKKIEYDLEHLDDRYSRKWVENWLAKILGTLVISGFLGIGSLIYTIIKLLG